MSSMVGHAPSVKIGKTEKEKYTTMWEHDLYRRNAPGEGAALTFMTQAAPKSGDTVIDFGCGTGRGAQRLQEAGLTVLGVDFAENCLDPDVDIQFAQADLTKPLSLIAKYGYCTDVMEHIPPESVQPVLENILNAVNYAFFQISCVDDVMGSLIGEPLHLTVKPYSWWRNKLTDMGCKILWSEDGGTGCQFFVAAPRWKNASDVLKNAILNVSEDKLLENIRINSLAGWKRAEPHDTQDIEVMLLGGGPTLANFEEEIREKRRAGMPLITTNGAYNWCLERKITPSAQVIVDGREFNKRFREPILPECKYLIASQCDPAILEGLPQDRTFLWHSANNPEKLEYISEHQETRVWPVPGGSTVMLRSIPLLRMLGFRKLHIYGLDSCIMDSHHAYAQAENDNDLRIKVQLHGRVFDCTPWMAYQAREFVHMAKILPDDIKLAVYGDGLIAHLIRNAAES